MSITRYSQRRGIGPEYMAEDSNGEYVRHCDYLAAVESLEYDIRYEREQKEEAEHERDFYKKLCEDNLDMGDVEF